MVSLISTQAPDLSVRNILPPIILFNDHPDNESVHLSTQTSDVMMGIFDMTGDDVRRLIGEKTHFRLCRMSKNEAMAAIFSGRFFLQVIMSIYYEGHPFLIYFYNEGNTLSFLLDSHNPEKFSSREVKEKLLESFTAEELYRHLVGMD